jgi:hypothetical protein
MTESGAKGPDPARDSRGGSRSEDEEWTSLLLDPRNANTQPSLRRREVQGTPSISMDAPTPVEPHSLRYRARRRRVGGLLLLLGVVSVAAVVVAATFLSRSDRNRPSTLPNAPSVIDAARPATAGRTDQDVPEDESNLASEVIGPQGEEPGEARAATPRGAPGRSPPAPGIGSAERESIQEVPRARSTPRSVQSGLEGVPPKAKPARSASSSTSATRRPWFPPE